MELGEVGVMEAGVQSVIIYLCGAGVVGLVVWVWALWKAHTDFKIKVTEEYLRHNSLDELKGEIHALRDLVYRIALKMEVPIFTEKY